MAASFSAKADVLMAEVSGPHSAAQRQLALRRSTRFQKQLYPQILPRLPPHPLSQAEKQIKSASSFLGSMFGGGSDKIEDAAVRGCRCRWRARGGGVLRCAESAQPPPHPDAPPPHTLSQEKFGRAGNGYK